MISTQFSDIAPKPSIIQEIVSLLDRLEGEVPTNSNRSVEYKQLVSTSSYAEVLERLVEEEQDLVLKKGNKGEIDSFYAILGTYIRQTGSPTSHHIPKIIEHLTKEKQEKKIERLSNLGHLYNLFPDSGLRYNLFAVILEYALASEQTSAVASQFHTIDNRLKELNANTSQYAKFMKLY